MCKRCKTASVVVHIDDTNDVCIMNNGIDELVAVIFHNAGEILIMDNGTQDMYTHSIPKEHKVRDARISLTFRRFN